MFFMFVIIFPANKDSRYSIIFPRVQRFMIIIASVAMGSGIVLTLVNGRFSVETLLMQNIRSRTATTAAVSSSLIIPSIPVH